MIKTVSNYKVWSEVDSDIRSNQSVVCTSSEVSRVFIRPQAFYYESFDFWRAFCDLCWGFGIASVR